MELEEHREHLFAVAYRMLGTVADAQDVVQETCVRWLRLDSTEAVISPRAFLTTTATRICIDKLRVLQRERERYDGRWLPEPLVHFGPDPYQSAELAASLSPAFLIVLETLSPVERAVFLLRDVFDFDYVAIGEITEKSEANCRQICRRARLRVREAPRFSSTSEDARALAARFFAAAASGDVSALIELLRTDVIAWSDHGGKASAARNDIVGKQRVARYLIGSAAKFAVGLRPEFAWINGCPGLVLWDCDKVHAVVFVETDGGSIARFGTVRNPDKLRLASQPTPAPRRNL